MRGGLRPDVIRIDRRRAPPRDDVIVDAVLDVPGAVLAVEKAPGVGLVLGEEHLPTPLAVQSSPGQEDGVTAGEGVPDPYLRRCDAGVVRIVRGDERQGRARRGTRQERPGVTEPERRQQVQRPGLGPSVAHGDAHEDVLGGRLGVLDEDVEVPVAVQAPGVQQLVLHRIDGPRPIDQLTVRIPIGVLVQTFHVGMGGQVVEVEVGLLDVLAVIAFGSGEAEEPLLDDRIGLVPHRHREAQQRLLIADPEDAVLAPAVRARAGLVVHEISPRVLVRVVPLPHRSPLPVAEVGAPVPPRAQQLRFEQTPTLRRPDEVARPVVAAESHVVLPVVALPSRRSGEFRSGSSDQVVSTNTARLRGCLPYASVISGPGGTSMSPSGSSHSGRHLVPLAKECSHSRRSCRHCGHFPDLLPPGPFNDERLSRQTDTFRTEQS